MARWVALLHGVNVNGITIRSPDLRAVFEELGAADVRTVLASGNVVFSWPEDLGGDRDGLKTRIEQALRDRFGYDAWIVLVPHDRLAAIVDGFPFPSAPDRHDYVVFGSDESALDDLVDADAIGALDPSLEQVARGTGVVYWSCPKGSSTDTAFAKRAAAARFKRTTTTRNRTTLRKLV